jgi:ABC-type Mn2+/Zn2+ transport system ATPase subunit
MAGTLDLIRDWATQLAFWEQAALEKVASGVVLTEKDYQKLLDLWMEDTGLIPKPKSARPTLNFPTKLAEGASGARYTFERLFNLQNVNALPAAQDITFGPQLTIIYGPNGSGKTSYTRPLGCAAFARGEREVLTDARKANAGEVPKADIEIATEGKKKTVSWVLGARCPELSGVYVFDGTSVTAHLTRSNALSFSPAGLSLLTDLAEVTDVVRERLRKLIETKLAPHSFSVFFDGESAVSREITNLSATTDVATLRKAAVLSTDEQYRVPELEQHIAVLKSRNIPKRVATLKQEVKDLEKLIHLVGNTASALGSSAHLEVEKLTTELEARRADAARLGADQFRFEQFTQVGTDVWREFIGKARALADAESQHGTSYPQSGDPCLLCRQALSPQATDLINRLWGFLASDAPARFQAAQVACRSRAEQFRSVVLSYFGPDAAARRILEIEATEIVLAVDSFLKACAARSHEFQSALTTGRIGQLTSANAPSLGEAHTAITRRLQEISGLETTDPQEELVKLEQPLRDLHHRRILSAHLAEIERWIDGLKWAGRAQKTVGSTRHITAKYNEFFRTLVTDQYQKVFKTTLQKLKHDLKLTIETRGKKGETVRQIVLSPDAFAQKVAVEKILSDGEKRAVALADFLTEVTLDTSSNAIVLDDPVSFCDLDSKAAVAYLLAERAAEKQVIVLTHDLAFLHALKVAAEKMSVGIVSHWMLSEGGQPGYVYLDNSPICEGDYKSAKIALERYAAAKNAKPAERDRTLQQGFGALRTSYEAFIIYGLFNGVVKRFEERVSFDSLKEVNLDRDVVEQVVEKLGALSRHIDAHLHSDIYAAEKPTPEMLLEEINAFEELRKQHKNSKKAVAATPSKAVPKIKTAGGGRGALP